MEERLRERREEDRRRGEMTREEKNREWRRRREQHEKENELVEIHHQEQIHSDNIKQESIEKSPCDPPREESPSDPPKEELPTASIKDKSPCVPPYDSLYRAVLRELECGLCCTPMEPPSLVWQCEEGHTQCGQCTHRDKDCRLCGKLIQGRNFALERIAQHIY